MNEAAEDFQTIDMDDGAQTPFFKSRIATEGDARILYIEPSTETMDSEREIIRRDAVIAAWPGYKAFGNVDLEHWTMRPPPGIKPGEEKRFQIGIPLDFYPERMVLKAELHRGEGQQAEVANEVWQSLTELVPPRRYYPSMAGKYLQRECTRSSCIVKAFLWRNTALAAEPINKSVRQVSLNEFFKSVTSGYATDISGLTGGQAIQKQSIQRGVLANIPEFNRLAQQYMKGEHCPHTQAPKFSVENLVAHFQECGGFDEPTAKAAAARLLRKTKAALEKSKDTAARAA